MLEGQGGMGQMLLGQSDDIHRLAERTAEPWRFADLAAPSTSRGRRVEGLRGLRGILASLVVPLARSRTRGSPQTACCSEP